MSENSANSKRIAKNTLMLYFRMLLMMGVTLYTSRVVLSALGVEDYGIYNVVGGVVAMFTMISGSLSSAISRFITFELGKGNQDRLNTIFSTSVIIQLIIGAIIAILIETVGVWFLANKMVIPPDRLYAAKWVLQFSLITLIINLISVPYNAAIIAHERMSAFAYISILEAFGKLAIAYFITIAPIDKLIFYAILMSLVALIVRFTYSAYCRRHFEEAKFRWVFNKALLKEMFGFAGWNFIGSSSVLLRDQGGNMMLNIFAGGPAVNAAMGIATQVKSAVTQFSTNFMVAMNPQITKSYASGNTQYMTTLIFQGTRYSFYLLLTLSLPILVNTKYILSLWLNTVPSYSVTFVQLALIFSMVESLKDPMTTAMLATGNIKKYQIIAGGWQLLNLPISYICLKAGCQPGVVLITSIAISFSGLFVRLYLISNSIGLPIFRFIKQVVLNLLLVVSVIIVSVYLVFTSDCTDMTKFILSSSCCVLYTLSVIFLIGCNRSERQFVIDKVKSIVRSKYSK